MILGAVVLLGALAIGGGGGEEIRAAVILPANPRFVAAIPKVMPVLRLAASRVSHLLPGRRLVFYEADDRCDSHHALKAAVSAKMCPDDSQRINVFFGPNCEYCVASVSRLLKYWSTPLLTTGALTFDFSKNKTAPDSEFHLLVRMGHLSFASMAHFLISILNKYGWGKVALVYQRNGLREISGKYTSKLMMETLVEFLKIRGINYRAYDLEKNNMSLAENLKREVGTDYSKKNKIEQENFLVGETHLDTNGGKQRSPLKYEAIWTRLSAAVAFLGNISTNNCQKLPSRLSSSLDFSQGLRQISVSTASLISELSSS